MPVHLVFGEKYDSPTKNNFLERPSTCVEGCFSKIFLAFWLRTQVHLMGSMCDVRANDALFVDRNAQSWAVVAETTACSIHAPYGCDSASGARVNGSHACGFICPIRRRVLDYTKRIYPDKLNSEFFCGNNCVLKRLRH